VQAETDRGWDQVIPQYTNTLKFGVYYLCTTWKQFLMSHFFNDPQSLHSKALTWSKYFVTMYKTLG